MDMAVKMGAPMIGLNDSGGARIQEGVRSLGGYADFTETYKPVVDSSNISYYGSLRWWSSIPPAMTDFTMMVEDTSYMFVTGPNVVKTVTNETVTSEELVYHIQLNLVWLILHQQMMWRV
jgi:propionyl-CoA carboxylase beta chain